MNRQLLLLYLALLLISLFLLGFNLGDRLLWGDEAETALLAVNITRYGIPKANDGVNRVTLLDGADWNEDGVWIWSPWLDEYLAAGSFLLLGKTTIAARLPFILCGLASIVFLALLAYRIHGTHAAAITAVVLLMTCVPFLTHARQCRYYAVLVFSQIWLLWGARQMFAEQTVRGSVHTCLALAAQFYCNYIVVPGNVLALGMTGLLWCRRVPGLLMGIMAAGCGLGVLALPWILYAPPGSQLQSFTLSQSVLAWFYYVQEIHFHVVPWVLLVVPLGVALARWCRYQPVHTVFSRFDCLLWCFVLSHLLVLSICPLIFFRYLMPLIPVLLLLAASVIEQFLARVTIRCAVLALLGLSNAVAWCSALPVLGPHRLESPLPEFVRSLVSNYTDRCEDVISYLAREARPGDSVYVPDPEFPLIFYTGLQVIDARFGEPLHEAPDWILPISPCAPLEVPELRLPASLLDKYDPMRLRVHASARGCRRPDPHGYRGFTTPKIERMTIYRKRAR